MIENIYIYFVFKEKQHRNFLISEIRATEMQNSCRQNEARQAETKIFHFCIVTT